MTDKPDISDNEVPNLDDHLEIGLVSCIIIFFNADRLRFFQIAIESVISQTYKHWELLLVDDGSTDDSGRIAMSYARTDSRIRYITHAGGRNRGMSSSRNLGLKNANGEFVAYIDADDYWFPEKLKEQIELMKNNPSAGFLFGRPIYWSSWQDRSSGIAGKEIIGKSKISNRTLLCGDTLDYIPLPTNRLYETPTVLCATHPVSYQNGAPSPSDLMIRTQVLWAVGGSEESFTGYYEDSVLLSKLYLHVPVYIAEATWTRYRQHPDSHCAVVESAGSTMRYRRRYLVWIGRYLLAQRMGSFRLRVRIVRELLDSLLPGTNKFLQYCSYKILKPAVRYLRRWIKSQGSAVK